VDRVLSRVRDDAKRIAASPPSFAIGPGRTGGFGEADPPRYPLPKFGPNTKKKLRPAEF